MAFALYVTTAGTVTQLNDGSPFRFDKLGGMGAATTARLQQRSPLQDGVSDLGYRLQPRLVELSLLFHAVDDSTLDSYRVALMRAFPILPDIETYLTVQRDDDTSRVLHCYRVGDIAIDLVPERRPGHLHRATVTLRAANPLWQAASATRGTATFTALNDWQLAGGAITVAQSRRADINPAIDTLVSFAGSVLVGEWAVGVVTAKDTAGTSPHYVWKAGSGTSLLDHAVFYRNGTANTDYRYFGAGLGGVAGTTWPGTTGDNYHVVASFGGNHYWYYWGGTSLVQYQETPIGGTVSYDLSLDNFVRWRGNNTGAVGGWVPAIRKGFVGRDITLAQMNALAPYIMDTLPGTVTVVNSGDLAAYPRLDLRGPMADPVITNQTTGRTINLTGGTIGSSDIWSIDLRTGDKQIYNQQGSSVLGSVATLPLTIADFSIVPHPTASGGTNVITLTAGSVGSVATFGVEFTAQYTSF